MIHYAIYWEDDKGDGDISMEWFEDKLKALKRAEEVADDSVKRSAEYDDVLPITEITVLRVVGEYKFGPDGFQLEPK